MSEFKKTGKEDWTLIPFLGLTLMGFAAAILDFVYRQNFSFQVFAVAGLLLLVLGGVIRMKARFELKRKAGFSSHNSTGRLEIVDEHQLVRDGLYRHLRHPMYCGEIVRNLGFVIIFSSVYGILIILLASTLLHFRIEIEEKMLAAKFGEEFDEYKKNTKRIVPYIY